MSFAPRLTGAQELLRSRVFRVERRTYVVDGQGFERDVAVHPGAVAVLPVDDRDEVVLVRQWRAPLGRAVLEVVAGTRDVPDEAPEATARRELEEEAGLRATHVEPLCSLWNSPGWSSQRTDVFVATGLQPVAPRPTGPEESAIEVVRAPIDEALALVEADGPGDATTLLALRTLLGRRR